MIKHCNIVSLIVTQNEGRHGHDLIVAGFTTKCAISVHTTKIACLNPAHGEVFSRGFSTNKTNCHNITEILLKVVLNTITLNSECHKDSNN